MRNLGKSNRLHMGRKTLLKCIIFLYHEYTLIHISCCLFQTCHSLPRIMESLAYPLLSCRIYAYRSLYRAYITPSLATWYPPQCQHLQAPPPILTV